MDQDFIEIESLDMDGRGVGHLLNADGTPGKVIFVEGALAGELVKYSSFKKKKTWEVAKVTEICRESALRVQAKCAYFGICGGCSMQHLEPSAQVASKQRVLEDSLWHIGKVKAEMIMRPVHGPTWGYRYRARLSVRHVRKKDDVLVGFHEKKSAFVADMRTCEILPAHVSAMLVPLRNLVASLSIFEQLPQIELAVGENITAMVLRIMAPLSADDELKLKIFADGYRVQWWLQTKGPESASIYYPAESQLHYLLPDFGIKMPFRPTDFTQVNHHINSVLVRRAISLLDVQPDQRIADFFCGLGNFTLPLATLAREVVGVEGNARLIERAKDNALENGLDGKTIFCTKNLFEITTDDLLAMGKFDAMLIDPPRDGAMAVCQTLAGLAGGSHADFMPRRIVYVSCSPATLARDAGCLVAEGGYVLKKAGVVNMFPHTSHVESMAVFELSNK